MMRSTIGSMARACSSLRRDSPPVRGDDVAKGGELAKALCARCHFNDGQGEKQGPMGIPGFVAVANRPAQTVQGIVVWLKSVPPMMPNHSPDPRREYALAAYIMTAAARSGPSLPLGEGVGFQQIKPRATLPLDHEVEAEIVRMTQLGHSPESSHNFSRHRRGCPRAHTHYNPFELMDEVTDRSRRPAPTAEGTVRILSSVGSPTIAFQDHFLPVRAQHDGASPIRGRLAASGGPTAPKSVAATQYSAALTERPTIPHTSHPDSADFRSDLQGWMEMDPIRQLEQPSDVLTCFFDITKDIEARHAYANG